MKIWTAIIIFFVAIIALIPEFILYVIFAAGAALSGGLSSVNGIAAFFVSLFILTIATAILAPICAIVEMIVIKYVDMQKEKHKKHSKVVELFYKDVGSFLLVSLLGLVILFLILFMSFATSQTEKVSPSLPQETVSQPMESVKIEEKTTPSLIKKETGIIATVNSAKKQQIIGECNEYGFGCDKTETGKTFLIIDVTVENKGITTQGFMGNYVSSSSFKIKDGEGYVYDSTYTSSLDQEFPSGEIQDGDKVRGKLAFEIPISAKGLKLTFKELSISLQS